MRFPVFIPWPREPRDGTEGPPRAPGMGLIVSSVIAFFALLAMFVATITWMTAPVQMMHGASREKSAAHPFEVKQHGHSYFVSPQQKAQWDRTRRVVPIVWFGSFAYLFVFTGLGGFEALRRSG